MTDAVVAFVNIQFRLTSNVVVTVSPGTLYRRHCYNSLTLTRFNDN